MKAFRCIGGPLDGEHATTEDFYGYRAINPETKKPYRYGDRRPDGKHPWEREPGMYEHLKMEYHQFNAGSRSRSMTTMVWIHKTLLAPAITARLR